MVAERGMYARDSLRASGSIKGWFIHSSGDIRISGRLETAVVETRAFEAFGGGDIGDINATTVTVNQNAHVGLGRFFQLHVGHERRPFKADKISATGKVYVDKCDVGLLKGDVVRVGRDSRIGRVEYVTSFEAEKGAIIDSKPVKVAKVL